MIENKAILGSFLAFSLLGAETIQNNITKETNLGVTEAKTNPVAMQKKTKTGILVGVELGLGSGNGKGEYRVEQVVPEEGAISTTSYHDITSFAFNTKIFGGYQKYFGKNETFGFSVKGSFGTGFLNYNLDNKSSIDDTGDIYEADPSSDLIANYVPISVGVEANFLYDFFQKAEHTVGLNVGVGYSFVYGVNTSMSLPNEVTSENFPTFSNIYKTFTDKNIYYSLISPKIGIHYYYDRHQIEFNFSFDKAFGESKNINNFIYGSFGEEKLTIKTKPDYFYTFNLSYAYRF
ncbi:MULTISPECIES: outer membrane beta-barrel protein [unclassified Helicobacter]|uniref:outer membrane beta-barrel protein n=1 Tax=unclassified Helicobacter TaxID=2593540 RepID=UPI000CF07FA9|nr:MULTISPECIES: outer membrane beta-barrel protein [unclassified Helicobacter]